MKSVFQKLEEVVYHPDNLNNMIENGYFSDNVTIEGRYYIVNYIHKFDFLFPQRFYIWIKKG